MIDYSTEDIPDNVSVFPRDTVPPTLQVEYPCEKCGREAGPYKGRGRKPKLCVDCKPVRAVSSSAPKVSGSAANLAAQATQVLCQMNGFMAMGLMAMKLFGTAGKIAEYDETFREQAYNALITDPDLCRYLLRGGVKSAKVALLVAYGGMAVAVAPTAVAEVKELQAERQARKDAENA